VEAVSSRLSSVESPSSSCAAERVPSTSVAPSSASRLTEVSVVVTAPVRSAAMTTLRLSSRVVAVCSSTAPAIVVWWWSIARRTSAIGSPVPPSTSTWPFSPMVVACSP
jgi:hypothetical protein